MEHNIMAFLRWYCVTVGAATTLFLLANGVADFWSRHQLADELVSLTSDRYAYTSDVKHR